MIISDSSLFRFSPDMNLAYNARKRLLWLSFGSGDADAGLLVSPAGPFPFPLGVPVPVSPFELAVPESKESGRKVDAQRSNSRQSNKDFASRYLLVSLASNRASSGSGFFVKIVGKFSAEPLSPDVSGMELSNSAALRRGKSLTQTLGWLRSAPLG
jgi:hypothetical protein